MKEIIGRKVGMTQVFAKDGTSYPVTVVEVLPNVVTQVKTLEKDGYKALQVGVEDAKLSRLNKCEKGIFEKANVTPIANASILVAIANSIIVLNDISLSYSSFSLYEIIMLIPIIDSSINAI